MHTQQVSDGESSVVFNLRQLMQLEQDRLQAEADAVHEQEAAIERARVEREAAEREQKAELVRRAELDQLEREAALLRVRLEAEAAERSARRQAEAAERSARELRERADARGLSVARQKRAAILACGMCAAVIGALAVQRLWAAPPAQPAADSGERALLEAQARELDQLRQYVANLRQIKPAPEPAPETRPSPKLKPKPKLVPRSTQRPRDVLEGIDDGDDPIGNM